MEIKENEQDSGLHARQALMKQRFIYRNTESQQQKPLYKEDEISLSASEISERELQIQDNTYNLKYENTRDKMKFQNNFQQETSSPHSLVFFSNCQIDLTMQENQHKSMENKFKFRHGNEESIQNSQLAFHNSNYQLNKERQFYENSIVENTSEGKNKKNSINSSKPYQGKTQPQEGENANSQDSKMNQKQQEEPHINPIQNKTLKHMIHQNKVNNIKKKFINNLITSCPSVTFKHLTRKQFGIINDFSSDFGYFIHNTNQLIFSEKSSYIKKIAYSVGNTKLSDVLSSFMSGDYLFQSVTYENGEAITNRIKICQKYFWNFIKDVAIVVIFQLSKNIDQDSLIYYLDYIIFLKYIDIPQKLQELETKLQISQTKLNWIKLIKLECLVLLIAHVACCIFLRIGLTEMRLNNDSWITQFKYDDNSNEKNYIISLYYIIITMTTIGYGDITPFTTNEKIFMILVAIVATNICAYSYTQINEIVKYEEQKKQIYQQTMQGINNEMNKMGLNILLQHKVRKHFEFQLYKEEEKKKYSENLFDVLPKSLKEEVLQELTQGLSNEIIVLKNMSTSCLKEVRNSIKQKVLFPEEIIVKHNELDNCIYYVAQGSVTLSIPVQVLSNEKYHKTPFMNVKTLTKNTAFGYEGFLLDQVSPYTIKSDGVGFLLLIQKDEFLSILKRHPRDYEMYMMLKDEALLNKKTENIIQNCMSCNDSNHQIGSCPYVTFFKKRWKKPIKQEVIRQTFNRQRKDRTKSNSYKNLIIYQDCAKEFVLTQQRDEEINELYNLLKSNKQATQKDFVSSETTNSSESDMTEQLEEDSSSFANFVNSQKLTVSLQNNLMQNQQQQKSNQFISTEQRGIQEQLKMKSKRESFEIKKGNSSDNTKNMNTTNGVQGVQSRQLYVIEEGEEDTIQQSMNRSLDSYNKIKKSIQESIFQRQNEEKQFEKNSSKQNENTSSNSSIFPPSSNEKVTQRNVDYQDLNIAPAQIYSNTSILNDIPDKNKVNSAQIIEDNSQNVSKTSINVSTSLQQARQNNNQQKKSTAQSPSKIENSKKRSSQTSIKDLNKFEMTSKHLTEEQWDIEDENNNMKLSGKKQVQANKEQTFQDEMFNIYQKNAKKALRSERRVSSLINKELESPYKFSTVSNLLFDDFTSPVLISPTKRKNKYTQSIIIQNLEHIENNPVFLHNQSSTSQSQFDSECIIQQTPSNQQISLQGNLISTSPLVLQKRSSQKMLSNQVKFSQNIQSHQPGNTTPRNSLPTNSAYPQQIDQQFDIQIPSKNRDQRARQSFSQAVQNDQAKYQPQSTSPKNSESKMNLMNMSMSEYKQQTLQNLNYASSQGKMQTHLMLSSGESHQYSSEYQIKFQEGLQDLDMLIVRKNLRIAYEKGFIKTDLVKVLDNEIDIDIMKNYNFYYPQKNARVVVFKLRRFQQVANSKKSKIVSKINIENKKKIRKSKQSEYSSLSVKNLSTKPNSATMNQLSRPSLRIS
ncbi:cyclic nucleotide-binding domain protein (macronuclear) [Tetrahymena thermophila SB210]|uniref:Cyclic nucleotide-binding domain protein n=1 Tax=Tetrahymena thermophila (strain SB210) TaxID=312017 RepID=Q22U28_TETTS|nr:cyclic nucleotide-binding domain protein [Tetrahymena thermophila SB210]EAR88859.2 cyclic nucleotide-binding domain protein [Tetrahymena thermophila SB210]|eukprot:XP_001009104.2 cyclic nucleotide-binding domain protein [Tetrahymena thermophila SB210]